MFYVVAYDITDNRRRNKLFKIMNGYGIRNQFSLFECHLSEKRYKKMVEIIERIIKKEEDNIKIYYFCKDCFNMIKALGNCSVTQEEDTIVI